MQRRRRCFLEEGKVCIRISFRDSLGSFVQSHNMIFPFEATMIEYETTALKTPYASPHLIDMKGSSLKTSQQIVNVCLTIICIRIS
jgi:hypothetical protein